MQRSFLGQLWSQRACDERQALTLEQRLKLSPLVARILCHRNKDVSSAESFFDPKLRNLLPDPFILKDMDRAVERVLKALSSHEKIVVYGDYDVDGATSTAILRRYFEELNYPVELYIPDRIDEGYGANKEALLKLRGQGATLVLMTDCGTTAFIPINEAKKVGLDVIVLDHHLSENSFPDACAIVNPNRIDQADVGLSNLCAAGVAFLFLVALNRKLHRDSLPDLMNLLDLVALGTVCDVMTLTGLNRAFVKTGLKVLQKGQNVGLRALSEVSGVCEKLSTYHLGFVLGPRINAGGRVGEADLGSRLLTTDNYAEATSIAEKLHLYNKQRQDLEKETLDAAHAHIEKHGLQDVILIGSHDWHPGVIGIVASRLKDFYRRPACVVSFDEKDEGKGSGRSYGSYHLGEAMHRGVRNGVLSKGGGHAMAAGFTVMKDQFEAFQQFLNDHMPLSKKEPTIFYDTVLTLSDVSLSLLKSLEVLEPFGPGYPSPRFVIENVKVKDIQILKEQHLRCQIVDSNGKALKMLAFRSVNTPLEEGIRCQQSIDCYGSLKIDSWGGRHSVSFIPEDIRLS